MTNFSKNCEQNGAVRDAFKYRFDLDNDAIAWNRIVVSSL
jgi:hypothetical protein